MTKNKGRGVFAIEDIEKDDILIFEKPIVHIDNKYNFRGYTKE